MRSGIGEGRGRRGGGRQEAESREGKQVVDSVGEERGVQVCLLLTSAVVKEKVPRRKREGERREERVVAG